MTIQDDPVQGLVIFVVADGFAQTSRSEPRRTDRE